MNTETHSTGSGQARTCQNCKASFIIDAEDFQFYDRIKVPPPTWCPECRAIRRMCFWNQSNLFRRRDSRTEVEVFSTYPGRPDITVYDHEYWWSDNWDPMSFGKEVDFSRPFLEQVHELDTAVPKPSRSIRGFINSDYSNQASYLKNCYLCFSGETAENCLYCIGFSNFKDSMDVYAGMNLELCYEIYQAGNCHRCFFSSDVEDCNNVWFSFDCIWCNDCFGCVGLRRKKYCLFNEQLTKEEYEKRVAELDRGSYASIQEIKNKLRELYLRLPHKYYHGIQNIDVTGDYVYNSKNSHYVYEVGSLENVRYSEKHGDGVKDSYDYTNWGEGSELVYESVSCGDGCQNMRFCFDCWPDIRDSEYCMGCHSCSQLFGCVGLRKKQYCILNKQYTKEEYEKLVPKIRQHMVDMPYVDERGRIYTYGEFFPANFSPLAYNETIAIEYYQKSKEEAIVAGHPWADPDEREFKTTIAADALPDHIRDVQDDIVKEVLQCVSCKKAYRVLGGELAFYRRFEIPLPRMCPSCRFKVRIGQRNPRKLWDRQCMCAGERSRSRGYANVSAHEHGTHPCSNKFETGYAPDRKEIVYCESCYNSEVA